MNHGRVNFQLVRSEAAVNLDGLLGRLQPYLPERLFVGNRLPFRVFDRIAMAVFQVLRAAGFHALRDHLKSPADIRAGEVRNFLRMGPRRAPHLLQENRLLFSDRPADARRRNVVSGSEAFHPIFVFPSRLWAIPVKPLQDQYSRQRGLVSAGHFFLLPAQNQLTTGFARV